MFLPRVDGLDGGAAEEGDNSLPLGEGACVLVVEDNPINQQIALKTIRKLGFPVKAVWNGQEAIDYLKSPSLDQPPPDVILMDVQGKIFLMDVKNDIECLLTLL